MNPSRERSNFRRYRTAFYISFIYIALMLTVGLAMSDEIRELIDKKEVLGRGYISLRYIVVISLSSLIIFIATSLVLKRMGRDRRTIEESLDKLEEKERSIKKAGLGLKRQEKLINNVLESALVFILILDEDFNIKRSTKNIENITEYREEELEEKSLSFLIDPAYIEIFKEKLESKKSHGLEISFQSKHGKNLYTYGTISREIDLAEDGNYYSLVFFDISERKHLEDRIKYLDSYDRLTDLPNRYLAEKKFTSLIAEQGKKENLLALLYIDIDHFAIINETKGHHAGDVLLRDIGDRLKKIMKKGDILARITQDKFIAIISGEDCMEEIENRIHEFTETTSIEWTFEDKTYIVSTTMGVALYPKDGPDFASLLKNANLALECAKEISRRGYEYYNKDRKCSLVKDLAIISDIKIALKEGQFYMDYQPIYQMETGEIENVESLIRWYHPQLGYIAPDEFIPAAENYWIIDEIGDYTLEEVFRQKRQWNLSGYRLAQISINISAISFSRLGFTEYIEEKLERYDLRGSEVVLELTESGFSTHKTRIKENVDSLRELGVKISMDDFGTGYSSLARLKDLPIDDIKLDRSFIVSLLEDNGQEIIETLISLAKALGKDVVSEGIETKEQYEILKELGSKYGQGYFLSRPMPPEEIEKLLKS